MSVAAATREEQYVLLTNISWRTYDALLRELDRDHRHLRLTYDRGDLEIMTLSSRHESYRALIGRIIEAMSLEFDIPIRTLRSWTQRREDLLKGLEPDDCYYIQNEPAVRGKLDIELPQDPPPDLAVEADVTRSSVDRMGIYAALGVVEVWRWSKQSVRIFVRNDEGDYVECPRSGVLPMVWAQDLTAATSQFESADENTIIRAFLERVRERSKE